jgi:hypothetical protein
MCAKGNIYSLELDTITIDFELLQKTAEQAV